MGNTIFIKGKKACAKTQRTRVEAIQMMKPPGGLADVVSFLCLFFQDLEKLLKPIYDLTRKGGVFHSEQQEAFDEIKEEITEAICASYAKQQEDFT